MLGGAVWGAAYFVFASLEHGWHNGAIPAFALLSCVPAAFALFGAWLTRWIGFSPFVLGVAWMGVELALAPVGLGLGLLAASQSDTALMPYVGRTLGYVVVAFVVAYVSALLVDALGRVRLTVPRPVPVTRSSDRGVILSPQILGLLPFLRLEPSQPRAPPQRASSCVF